MIGIAERIMDGKYLNSRELTELVEAMRSDQINDLQFVSILAAMETRNRIKGINTEECANLIRALRMPIETDLEGLLCNSSTGGSRIETLNVGTSAAVVLAADGVKVLKTGYKSITGRFGSRDLLKGLGIDPFLSLDKVISSVKEIGLGYYDFLNLIVKESRSGFRSPLHYLGPICHPMKVSFKILGCVNKGHLEAIEPIVENVFDSYMLTYNYDIDEISTITPTLIREKRRGLKKEYTLSPNNFNIKKVDYRELRPKETIEAEVKELISIYTGKDSPKSDLIALNAASCLYLVGKAESINEGFEKTREILKSGIAFKKLNEWIAFQNKLKNG